MINFLRGIRRRLIDEGALSKYLLYAAGEIVLIVVGILIALQLNDWNAKRAQEERELKMLNELFVNLRHDSTELSANKSFSERIELSALAVAEGLDAGAPWADSMETHYGWLLNSGIANLNLAAYENLKTIGFDLISNDSLRIAIANLYNVSYDRLLQYDRDLGIDATVNLVAPVVLPKIRITTPWLGAIPLDYDALANDFEFREIVRWKAANANWMTGVYGGTGERTDRVIKLIEEELERR